MKVLVSILPFIIDDCIPVDEPHWINFLLLLQINQLSFTSIASVNTYNSLLFLTSKHFRNFVELYGAGAVTPKLHYTLHFAQQLRMFGPLHHQNCMRFEAKHGQLKSKNGKTLKQ